jgi:hypothetical protein
VFRLDGKWPPSTIETTPSRTRKRTPRRHLLVALVSLAALVAIGWLIAGTTTGSSDRSSHRTIPLSEIVSVEAPPAHRAPAGTSASENCGIQAPRPRSGIELGGSYRGGRGRITVNNGSASDALAVLQDAFSRRPRRAIYIRTGETGIVTSIPPGRYQLLFQFGEVWLHSRRFCHVDRTAQFDDVFAFDERTEDDGVTYRSFRVTLHAVPNGEATTSALPNEPLLLPPS